MKIHKLTDRDGYTRRMWPGKVKWKIEVPVRAAGNGNKLCSSDVIHGYRHPELGVVMNVIHSNFRNPRLFEGEGEIVVEDSTKCGVKELVLLRELEVPRISLDARLRWAIYLAQEAMVRKGLTLPVWEEWAAEWLEGKHRYTEEAARVARTVETEREMEKELMREKEEWAMKAALLATWAVARMDTVLSAEAASWAGRAENPARWTHRANELLLLAVYEER